MGTLLSAKLQYAHGLCTIVKIMQRLYPSYSQYSTAFHVIYSAKRRRTKPTNQRESNDQCCHVIVTN